MKERFVVGRIVKGVLVNAGGYIGGKLMGTEGIKEELTVIAPVVEQPSMDAVTPVVEDYPLWEDPDSLKMLSIIRANNKRNGGR